VPFFPISNFKFQAVNGYNNLDPEYPVNPGLSKNSITLLEAFEKCSILFKFKEGENFKCRNTLSISRLKI